MSGQARYSEVRTWWHKSRPFSVGELVADGIVHGVGLALAVSFGTLLVVLAAIGPARGNLPALVIYVASLLTVLALVTLLAKVALEHKTRSDLAAAAARAATKESA